MYAIYYTERFRDILPIEMSQMSATLAEQHIVVTGASQGIGAAIVDALSAQGARMSLMARRLPPLEDKASQLPQAQAISVDVTQSDAVVQAFQQARQGFGAVDILVNCAGQAHSTPTHLMQDADWHRMIAVNLDALFYCCREALADMRSTGRGRIVNIASSAALKGYNYVAAYCAAKHGALGLTRALALEHATRNITVNAVCPGYTDTELMQTAIQTLMDKTGRDAVTARAAFTQSNPQGRLIDPAEVAATVVWLCSPEAGSITGQAIAVAGGEVMH